MLASGKASCDARLAKYRAALDNGADPTVVGAWIGEVQGDRLAAEQVLAAGNSALLDEHAVRALVASLGDIGEALGRADPGKKARLYGELGLTMTYRPDENAVAVELQPCAYERVGGGV